MGQFLHYVSYRRSHIFHLTVEHAKIVVIAVILATIISVTLGVLVYRRERAAAVVLAVVGTFLTIPSFALFGLLIPIFGLGFNPTLVALTMYALLPITRNTVTGLRGVDEAVVESAQGMGMNRAQRLFRIEGQLDLIVPHDIDQLADLGRGRDRASVELLQLVDVLEDAGKLRGERLQLVVAQAQAGQFGDVSHLLKRQLHGFKIVETGGAVAGYRNLLRTYFALPRSSTRRCSTHTLGST
jgi:hypothetical protein